MHQIRNVKNNLPAAFLSPPAPILLASSSLRHFLISCSRIVVFNVNTRTPIDSNNSSETSALFKWSFNSCVLYWVSSSLNASSVLHWAMSRTLPILIRLYDNPLILFWLLRRPRKCDSFVVIWSYMASTLLDSVVIKSELTLLGSLLSQRSMSSTWSLISNWPGKKQQFMLNKLYDHV